MMRAVGTTNFFSFERPERRGVGTFGCVPVPCRIMSKRCAPFPKAEKYGWDCSCTGVWELGASNGGRNSRSRASSRFHSAHSASEKSGNGPHRSGGKTVAEEEATLH